MSTVALIPARGGSQRIPHKNIAICAQKPLLAWTAEAAIESRLLDRAILSTDSDEIARLGVELGIEVPFRRPASLSGSEVPMAPVMRHALAWLKEEGATVEALVLLQPSSPLRRGWHIDEAIELFREKGAETVVSVVPIPHIFHPRKALRIRDGLLANYLDEGGQELDAAYGRNGPAILINRPSVIERGERFGETIMPYVMAPEDSIDIDEPLDLALAEFLLRRRSEFDCSPGCGNGASS